LGTIAAHRPGDTDVGSLFDSSDRHPELTRLTEAALRFVRGHDGARRPGANDASPSEADGPTPADEPPRRLSLHELHALIESGRSAPEGSAMLSALYALVARDHLRDWLAGRGSDQAAHALFRSLLAFNVHSDGDAFRFIDDTLDRDAATFWAGFEHFLETDPDLSSGEQLAGVVALGGARSPAARDASARLRREAVRRLLMPRGRGLVTELVVRGGQRGKLPRGPWRTALLLLTGLLPLLSLTRWLAHTLLGFRRPVTLRVSPEGVTLEQGTELAGRVLRESRRWLAFSEIALVVRERSFARAGLYIGLLILLAAIYLGTGLIADGLQVAGGSRALLGSGALIVGAGILLHFLLSTLIDDVRGRCTLVITPRNERPYVLVDLSLQQAEAAFDAIRQRHLEASTPRRRAL
jgi:hypothetical protein